MRRFSRSVFLEDLSKRGITSGGRYGESHKLRFSGTRPASVSWEIPAEHPRAGALLDSVVHSLPEGSSRFVFRREFEDVLEFAPAESDALAAVLLGYHLFSPALGEPLYLIPSDFSSIFTITRNGRVELLGSTAERVEQLRTQMAMRGFEGRKRGSTPSIARPPSAAVGRKHRRV
jgi:hypothetical protein